MVNLVALCTYLDTCILLSFYKLFNINSTIYIVDKFWGADFNGQSEKTIEVVFCGFKINH